MRISIITAKTKDGMWVTLAQPDVSLQDQKDYFKQLKMVNGKGVTLPDGSVTDLAEAHQFVSGNGKRIRFKEPAVEAEAQSPDGFAKNLKELQAALGFEKKAEFDKARKEAGDGFPKAGDDGYDIQAAKAAIGTE